MENPRNFKPIKLGGTRRYPGYQFFARIIYNGLTPEETFSYVVLVIYEWLLSKVPEEDLEKEALTVPEPTSFSSVSLDSFKSYHENIGYALDITSIPSERIWSMRLKEPDHGIDDRMPVVGRFFSTRVGICINSHNEVELAVKIDITDPSNCQTELPYAFRPHFMRVLFSNEHISVMQIDRLSYNHAKTINTDSEYKQLLYIIDNEDNLLPTIILTYAKENISEKISLSPQDLLKEGSSKLLLERTISPLLLTPKLNVNNINNPISTTPKSSSMIDKYQTKGKTILPYDADKKLAEELFAYARTYIIADQFIGRLNKRLKADLLPGDIIFVEPKRFKGKPKLYRYPGESVPEKQQIIKSIVKKSHEYSKHKINYDFGSTIFEAEARKLEYKKRSAEIVNSHGIKQQDKINELTAIIEYLNDQLDIKEDSIQDLKNQVYQAYERGLKDQIIELEQAEASNNELRQLLQEKQAYIDSKQGIFDWVQDVQKAIDNIRKISSIPCDNVSVTLYFETVFCDSIVFTKRGKDSASKCGLKPSTLWNAFYLIATNLISIYRDSNISDKEQAFIEQTGWEMASHEGSMTRDHSKLMRLREDTYNGKVISIEPHVKVKEFKGDPTHQRIHFCFNAELNRIIIGYVGNHLESASSRYVK